jgi:hypothetical protein
MNTKRTLPGVVLGTMVVALMGGCASAERTPAPLPTGADAFDLDPADFTTAIDNPYWPMTPGTQWVYRETDPDGELTVYVTVTSDTKRIANGIEARVVRDSVFRGDELVEDTFDWYAQDADGAIWYLGEDTAEFENGTVASREGSFEAGVDGALAGIALPADPHPGMSYRQEYYAGHAEDEGAVLGVDELVEVPFGAYQQAVLTRDTTPLEPNVEELKIYARDVGPVLTVAVSGGSGREELLRIEHVPDGTATGPLGSPD